MIEIKVPTVGESITSGTLGAWRKKPGEYVKEGEILLEIETDKVTSEVYAEVSGTLQQMVSEGTEVKIGQVVGQIDETAPKPAQATPAAQPSPTPTPSATLQPSTQNQEPKTEGKALSPSVRKLVEEKGVNPATIRGTGKEGRILKEDVTNFITAPQPHPTRSASVVESIPDNITASASSERTTRKKMTSLRRKIADRLVSAQHQAALLTTFNEVDMSNVMAMRAKFQDRFTKKHGLKVGFMSFFTKAVIYALKEVPQINARIEGDEIVQNHFYDIGVAISAPKGLLVPVLRNVDQLSMAAIEQAISDYAVKARDGKISMPDLEGGVFTITNGGTFGSLLSTPIINPPQSGILGMHAIQDRPVAINGQVMIRPMMYLALTYDHRIVDGKEAVTFLVRIKEFIENPGVQLLEL
jgi:2-oxoglutarate dehydrogenase E2 component (dihydrolipoamide succinyltransferase)